MRTLMTTFLAATLSCGSTLLLAQQQSPSTNGSTKNNPDVPHQEPGTDSPDLGKQRVPAPKQSPGQNNPATKNPTQGTSDVPHQQPGTDSPDMGKQRRATPGTSTSKTKSKRKKNKSTTSPKETNTAQTSTQS